MDVRISRWRSIQGRYLLTSRAGTPPTGERLGGTSDPQARLAQEERGALVTWGDYRTGEKAAGTSSLLSGIVKLLGLMPSLDSRGRSLGSMLTDPTLRQPALSP
jgi:hypothetical protein